MTHHLKHRGYRVNRKRIQRLMRLMGIEAIYPKPKRSAINSEHRIYPYLLRDYQVTAANEVWSADITYIPVEAAGSVMSMDGVGRAIDNIYIERFWRSVKYEDVYQKLYPTAKALLDGLTRYIRFYNYERLYCHRKLGPLPKPRL